MFFLISRRYCCSQSEHKSKIQGYHTANEKQLSCVYQSANIWHVRCNVLGCGYLHGHACIYMPGIFILFLSRQIWGNGNFMDPAREWSLALLGLSVWTLRVLSPLHLTWSCLLPEKWQNLGVFSNLRSQWQVNNSQEEKGEFILPW